MLTGIKKAKLFSARISPQSFCPPCPSPPPTVESSARVLQPRPSFQGFIINTAIYLALRTPQPRGTNTPAPTPGKTGPQNSLPSPPVAPSSSHTLHHTFSYLILFLAPLMIFHSSPIITMHFLSLLTELHLILNTLDHLLLIPVSKHPSPITSSQRPFPTSLILTPSHPPSQHEPHSFSPLCLSHPFLHHSQLFP